MADTTVQFMDAAGVAAKETVFQGHEDACEAYAISASNSAQAAATLADRYPLRNYDTSVTQYSFDQLQSASDIVSSSGGTGGTWSLGGDGDLDVSAGSGSTANIVFKCFGTGTTFSGTKSLSIRMKCSNGWDDVTIEDITVQLQDSAGNPLWTGAMKTVYTKGMDQYYAVIEQVPAAGHQADQCKVSITWQCSDGEAAAFEFRVADAEFFNDHDDVLTYQEVMRSGRAGGTTAHVKKTSSYTAVAGVDEGRAIVMEAPSSTNIDLTLNDTSWSTGARIRIWIDTPGSGGTVDIVAGGGASLIPFGTVTSLGASHAGALIEAEFDGADWLVSSPV